MDRISIPICHFAVVSSFSQISLYCWSDYQNKNRTKTQLSKSVLKWSKSVLASEVTTEECGWSLCGSIVNRFCVAVKREGYPEDAPLLEGSQTKGLNVMSQPAHTLTIMYPMMLVNLLPCDFSYQVKNTPAQGNIKAGKSVPLYTVSTTLPIWI